MKVKRKIIHIDEEKCTGCGLCVPSCAEGAIRIMGGKARLVAEKYCDGLGACLGECPEGALRVIDAEVDLFDEAAALAHVRATGHEPGNQYIADASADPPLACGCPSTVIQTFKPQVPRELDNTQVSGLAFGNSALTHWPVQIHLVQPTAPFLRGAELLIASDCVPAAYHGFHDDLLRGRVLLMGCPKLDDTEAYIQKLAAIFTEDAIKGISVAVMEVPCCQGMPVIVKKALVHSGKQIPFQVVTISTRGERLR